MMLDFHHIVNKMGIKYDVFYINFIMKDMFYTCIIFVIVAKPSHNPDDYYDYSDYSNNVSDYSNNLDNSDEDSDDYSGGHSWVRYVL